MPSFAAMAVSSRPSRRWARVMRCPISVSARMSWKMLLTHGHPDVVIDADRRLAAHGTTLGIGPAASGASDGFAPEFTGGAKRVMPDIPIAINRTLPRVGKGHRDLLLVLETPCQPTAPRWRVCLSDAGRACHGR